MAIRPLAWVILAVTLVLPMRADGETFELANGGRIRGEWLNPDESPRRSYDVRTADGATIRLTAGQVSRVAEKSAAEQWYEEATAEVPATVERHLAIAAECRTKKLDAQRIFHLEEALKLDSEHEAARRELGYTRLNGSKVSGFCLRKWPSRRPIRSAPRPSRKPWMTFACGGTGS
jgi:hypothetical protein